MTHKAYKTPFSSETTYGEFHPSNTPDLQAARDTPDQSENLAPVLQSRYDRARQTNANRLNSSYNQNIPQDARLAMQQQADRDYNADYGTQLQQAAYDANNAKFNRRMQLALATLGRPLQTSQSGYNSQVGNSVWGDLLSGAQHVAGAYLAGGG